MFRTALILAIVFSANAFAQCARCQEVREYNAAHPENNYTYYDDYLKDHPQAGKKEPSKAPAEEPTKGVYEKSES